MTSSDYIERQEKDWHRQLLHIIRETTLDYDSAIKESMKFSVPFFARHQNISFLNVPVKKDLVQVGFYWGVLLNRELDFLENNNLKQVRHLSFSSIEDFEDKFDLFNQAMLASIVLDDKVQAIKKKKIPITKILRGDIAFE